MDNYYNYYDQYNEDDYRNYYCGNDQTTSNNYSTKLISYRGYYSLIRKVPMSDGNYTFMGSTYLDDAIQENAYMVDNFLVAQYKFHCIIDEYLKNKGE